MSKVLIIGCGGVASVAIHKCCQVPEVFTEICIASRTKAKCDKLAAELAPKTTTKITTAQVDADHVDEVIALIKSYQPDLVMNIALPYQDLTIMDACLACGVNYMDTANYEPENTDDPEWRAIYEKRCKEAGFSAYFDYSWQWAYAKKFEEAGLTALLGSGFDPGVTQAYCAYAKKHEFDTIDTIEHELRRKLNCNAVIHMDPVSTSDPETLSLKAEVSGYLDQIDPKLSMHDFRIVKGPTHTNVIFDIVIPYDYPVSDQEVMDSITKRIQTSHPDFFTVIEVDKAVVQ